MPASRAQVCELLRIESDGAGRRGFETGGRGAALGLAVCLCRGLKFVLGPHTLSSKGSIRGRRPRRGRGLDAAIEMGSRAVPSTGRALPQGRWRGQCRLCRARLRACAYTRSGSAV